MRSSTLRTATTLLAFFAVAFIVPLPGMAQDSLASRQWEVKQTAGHYDNRPQEVVFFIPGSGVLQVIEDVQPFCECGRVGWQYFSAQHRKRGTADWERGWPREVTIAKRTCNEMVDGKPYRCESTLKVSPGGENYQVRILMSPNRYWDGLGHTTPAQVLAVAVKHLAQGDVKVNPPEPSPANNPTATSKMTEVRIKAPCSFDVVGPWNQISAPGGVFAGRQLTPGQYRVWVSPKDEKGNLGLWTPSGPYAVKAGEKYLVTVRDGGPPIVSWVANDARLGQYSQPVGVGVPYFYNTSERKLSYGFAVCPVSTPPNPPSPPTPPCDFVIVGTWDRISAPGAVFAGPRLTPGVYRVWVSPKDEKGNLAPWTSSGPYTVKAGDRYLVTVRDGNPPIVSWVANDARLGQYSQPVGAGVPYFYNTSERKLSYGFAVCPVSTPLSPPCGYDVVGTWDRQSAPGGVFAGRRLTPGQYEVWVSPRDKDGNLGPWTVSPPYAAKAGDKYLVTVRDGSPPIVSWIANDVRLGQYSQPVGVGVTYYYNVSERKLDYAIAVCSARTSHVELKSGDVQVSLFWKSKDDLDLHVIAPSGEEIFFGHRKSKCNGQLDVDMNSNYAAARMEAVENVFWPKGKAPPGKYKVYVNLYSHYNGQPGTTEPVPFHVRVTVRERTQEFSGSVSNTDKNRKRVLVHEFQMP